MLKSLSIELLNLTLACCTLDLTSNWSNILATAGIVCIDLENLTLLTLVDTLPPKTITGTPFDILPLLSYKVSGP